MISEAQNAQYFGSTLEELSGFNMSGPASEIEYFLTVAKPSLIIVAFVNFCSYITSYHFVSDRSGLLIIEISKITESASETRKPKQPVTYSGCTPNLTAIDDLCPAIIYLPSSTDPSHFAFALIYRETALKYQHDRHTMNLIHHTSTAYFRLILHD